MYFLMIPKYYTIHNESTYSEYDPARTELLFRPALSKYEFGRNTVIISCKVWAADNNPI